MSIVLVLDFPTMNPSEDFEALSDRLPLPSRFDYEEEDEDDTLTALNKPLTYAQISCSLDGLWRAEFQF